MDAGNRADQARADEQRHRDDGLDRALRVAETARGPFLIVRDDQRFARLRHTPHRAFSVRHPRTDGIGAHLKTCLDHERLLCFVHRSQFTAAHVEQGHGALQHAFEHGRELEFAGEVGEGLEQRLLFLLSPTPGVEDVRVLDRDAGVR